MTSATAAFTAAFSAGAATAQTELLPSDLPRISLAELNQVAAMMTRVDRKYALTRAQARAVLAALDPRTQVLEIGGQVTQNYESVYFDDTELTSFMRTAHPRRRRFKVRTRVYLDSDLAFLEVKTRGPRGTTVKHRLTYPLLSAGAGYLTRAGKEWLEGELAPVDENAAQVIAQLRPALRVGYRRATLFLAGADGGVAGRATIDDQLRWDLPADLAGAAPSSHTAAGCEPTGPVSAGHLERADLVIIETKSGAVPSALDRALWAAGHRPARISKFGTALAALRPELPHCRWARTLDRHFS